MASGIRRSIVRNRGAVRSSISKVSAMAKCPLPTRTRPGTVTRFGRNPDRPYEERFQDERPVHNNVAVNGKVFTGAASLVAVSVLLVPRFFTALHTGAGADPSPPNAPHQK